MIYYIGDLHLMHENCLKFDNRPFETVEEMNEAIITNWNSKVTKRDTVFVVGDVCMKVTPEVLQTLRQLNGTKYLAIGNHDAKLVKELSKLDPSVRNIYFSQMKESYFIKDGEYNVFISHFPHASWNRLEHGSVHVYAHIHANYMNPIGAFMLSHLRAANAGCMLHHYTPVTLQEMFEDMKPFRSFMFEQPTTELQ